MSRAAFIGLLLAAGTARALPVDRTIELSPGDPQFVRQNYVEAFEVDPPDLCRAEQMKTLEILLTPRRVGEGLLYLYEEGRLEVFRLVVRDPKSPAPERPADAALLKAARTVCPEVDDHFVEGEHFLHAQIPDGICRAACLALLAANPYDAGHLRLVFGIPALQAQLGAMQERLRAAGVDGITLTYAGATLTMKGKATPELRHRALKAIWPVTVGRLNVEDETEDPGAK